MILPTRRSVQDLLASARKSSMPCPRQAPMARVFQPLFLPTRRPTMSGSRPPPNRRQISLKPASRQVCSWLCPLFGDPGGIAQNIPSGCRLTRGAGRFCALGLARTDAPNRARCAPLSDFLKPNLGRDLAGIFLRPRDGDFPVSMLSTSGRPSGSSAAIASRLIDRGRPL